RSTGTPILATATAWLAPLPPGTRSHAVPATVSPRSGNRPTRTTTSMLIEPKTQTREAIGGSSMGPHGVRPTHGPPRQAPSATGSPPARVARAFRLAAEIEYGMNRTLPSAKPKNAPPVWALQKWKKSQKFDGV